MIKLTSFIVLTHFFQFSQLKNFKATRLLTFLSLNQQYFSLQWVQVKIPFGK